MERQTRLAASVVNRLRATKVGFDPAMIIGIITAIFQGLSICRGGQTPSPKPPTPKEARDRVLEGRKKNGEYKAGTLNPATKLVLEKWQESGERSGFKKKRNKQDAQVIATAHLDAIAEASDDVLQEQIDAME